MNSTGADLPPAEDEHRLLEELVEEFLVEMGEERAEGRVLRVGGLGRDFCGCSHRFCIVRYILLAHQDLAKPSRFPRIAASAAQTLPV